LKLKELPEIAQRIHAQQRHDQGKVYGVDASEVECIAKGKAHKPYEFGQTRTLTGRLPKEAYVDRGYRGHRPAWAFSADCRR
jgi:IS5 family transposase